MKKNFLVLIFLWVSSFSFSQETQKVELQKTTFKSSFAYSIKTDIKSNFTVEIVAKKEILISKIHNNVVGKQFFKIDLINLKKDQYFFRVLDEDLNIIFQKKIKKIQS